MSVAIIQKRLESYGCKSVQEEENAIREIAQEVVLGGLSRSGFFKKAVFQGGTCLRILYGLGRFSEDLDFVLIEREGSFLLHPYLEELKDELRAYGFKFELQDRRDTATAVQAEFLKDDSIVKLLTFLHFKPGKAAKSIRIKIEVDTNPPLKSMHEIKYHDFPFAYEVVAQDVPSLFASKSHALLCRPYVKGRDWYDFLWYIARKSMVNFELLSSAVDQLGPWKGKGVQVDKKWYLDEMRRRIEALDIEETKKDVQRFIKPSELASLEVWNKDFFLDRLGKLASYL